MSEELDELLSLLESLSDELLLLALRREPPTTSTTLFSSERKTCRHEKHVHNHMGAMWRANYITNRDNVNTNTHWDNKRSTRSPMGDGKTRAQYKPWGHNEKCTCNNEATIHPRGCLPFLDGFLGPPSWPVTSCNLCSNCCFFSRWASSRDFPGVFLAEISKHRDHWIIDINAMLQVYINQHV